MTTKINQHPDPIKVPVCGGCMSVIDKLEADLVDHVRQELMPDYDSWEPTDYVICKACAIAGYNNSSDWANSQSERDRLLNMFITKLSSEVNS
jgi:hypothetical protein